MRYDPRRTSDLGMHIPCHSGISYAVITDPYELLMGIKRDLSDCSALEVIRLRRQLVEALQLTVLSFFVTELMMVNIPHPTRNPSITMLM